MHVLHFAVVSACLFLCALAAPAATRPGAAYLAELTEVMGAEYVRNLPPALIEEILASGVPNEEVPRPTPTAGKKKPCTATTETDPDLPKFSVTPMPIVTGNPAPDKPAPSLSLPVLPSKIAFPIPSGGGPLPSGGNGPAKYPRPTGKGHGKGRGRAGPGRGKYGGRVPKPIPSRPAKPTSKPSRRPLPVPSKPVKSKPAPSKPIESKPPVQTGGGSDAGKTVVVAPTRTFENVGFGGLKVGGAQVTAAPNQQDNAVYRVPVLVTTTVYVNA